MKRRVHSREFKLEVTRQVVSGEKRLSHELSKARNVGSPCTPAMAAGLTDHVWGVGELLSYRIPPLPWVPPKRPQRRSIEQDGSIRPRLRLRKGVLCSTI